MNYKIVAAAIFIALSTARISWASGCRAASGNHQPENKKNDPLNIVLEKLNKKTSELRSYESRIEYKYLQPLLESESVRKGVLYYARSGGKSALNMNFNTLKQDDAKEQKNIEQYFVLDGSFLPAAGRQLRGIWLAQLDYQIREVKYYELAEPNDPNESTDVFDLAGKKLPMLGFSKIDELKKQFEIQLVEREKGEPGNLTQVHLEVKPNSIYRDDYVSIDFWIDDKSGLPTKIVAVKTEPEPPYGDIEEIRFFNPKVNKDIDKEVFELTIPKGFGEPQIFPLERKK
jgi:outer membrane lipoprotein-sorting protein